MENSPANSGRRIIDWLMEGDPAIRYQTLRDLREARPIRGAGNGNAAAERARIAREGWGRRFMEARDPATGMWGGGMYSPKWVSTHYTLLDLMNLGIDPDSSGCGHELKASASLLLEKGFAKDDGIGFGITVRDSDLCVTGMVLGVLSFFGVRDPRMERLAAHILGLQLPDGGWNCAWSLGSEHYSAHTTISILEGLWAYAQVRGAAPDTAEIDTAMRRGRECLMEHRLFRSLRTGLPISGAFTMLSFPCRWHYDILRALDHFRAVGAPYDPRMEDALDILRQKRRADGTWPVQHRHQGLTHFEMEKPGTASRWNTLRALRVLDAYGARGEARGA